MEIKLGKIDNTERKFIIVRDDCLNLFLDKLNIKDEYFITQFYVDGYKYREIKNSECTIHFRSLRKDNITDVMKINYKLYNNNLKKVDRVIKKYRKSYEYDGYLIDIDEFIEPLSFKLMEVSSCNKDLNKFNEMKGSIDVTDNERFKNANIINGSIISSNFYLEGTDGVGKTTLIKELLKDGIICHDRDLEISKYMLKDISLKKRVKEYSKYLANTNKKIIFMINNSSEEINLRIYNREKISEFDKEANLYNKMYDETYLELEKQNKLYNKLFKIDCTNKSIYEEVSMAKNIILPKNED